MQKTALKSTKYLRNETIFKIDHIAKAIAHAEVIAFAKWSVVSKIKNAKNMRKTVLQERYSFSVQNAAPKNTKYSRNGTILKIDHVANAIPFAKWSVWLKL